MSIVADSSVWIALLSKNGSIHSLELEKALRQRIVLLPDLVVVEVLRGVKTEAMASQVAEKLRECDVVKIGGWDLSVKAAANYRALRSKGITIRSTVDLLIGTWCIENELPLLHDDRDFSGMEEHLSLQVWRGAGVQ